MAAKGRNIFLFLYILTLCAIFSRIGAQKSISLVLPDNCKSQPSDTRDRFFDISQLQCDQCSQTKEFQKRSADGLSCECQQGYKYTKNFGGKDVECEKCPTGSITVNEGWDCVVCDASNPYDDITKQCTDCQVKSVAVHQRVDGSWYTNTGGQHSRTCKVCSDGTFPSKDGTRCETCSQILSSGATGSSACDCPTDQFAGGLCFQQESDLDSSVDDTVKAEEDVNVASAFLRHNLKAAVAMCKAPYSNLTACQTLGNMCVLTYFKDTTGGSPCRKYKDVEKLQTGSNYWPPNMPWLYYPTDTQADRLLTETGISTSFSFNQESTDSVLHLKVAKYHMNGTFLGLEDVTGETLQLCQDDKSLLNASLVFGTTYTKTCSFPTQNLWDKDKYLPVFYDMYIEYTDTTNQAKKLYPIPVAVLNYDSVNAESTKKSEWKLVRRFFLVNNQIFIKEAPGSSQPNQDPTSPDYVRYAASITLTIELVQETTDGKIYPPYLTIDYKDANKEDFDNAKGTANLTFSVVYTMNQEKYDEDLSIAMSVFSILAALYAGVRTWSWYKRTARQAIDFVTIIKFLLYGCGSIANAFFVVILGAAFWKLVYFKNQDIVNLVPHTEEQERSFVIYISIAFALKILDLLHLFIVQCTIDIFFIDWEKPRTRNLQNGDAEKPKEEPVSIWRTYFVANEWNEIQTLRKMNHTFTIVVVLFFLHVVGFGYVATMDPNSNFSIKPDIYRADDSRIFRFALGASIYMLVGIIQWIWWTFIFERFISDPVREFVDLCSMANISVFIMETSHFGYYIHGRSVHGRADTGLKEMHENLKKEENDLCGHRGLDANTDQQTFRMALPRKLRGQYDRVLLPLQTMASQPQNRMERGQPGQGAGNQFQMCVDAYQIINRFLSSFIDHSLRGLDYQIKDKLMLESILDAEFDDTSERGLFFNDDGHSFDSVLFFGNEGTLFFFDIMLFCIVDLIAQNYILAGILTYIIGKLLVIIRNNGGKKNLAKKTLVDERFLI